jgi:hypothetical protein
MATERTFDIRKADRASLFCYRIVRTYPHPFGGR